jgi:hypothetical protein
VFLSLEHDLMELLFREDAFLDEGESLLEGGFEQELNFVGGGGHGLKSDKKSIVDWGYYNFGVIKLFSPKSKML